MLKPKIFIGADHAGLELKERIKIFLAKHEYHFEDLGAYSLKRSDYQKVAFAVAKKVAQKPGERRGILICGTGTGMVIAANKVPGIRAAFAYDSYSAKMAREHNNANILTLRGRQAKKIPTLTLVKTFLSTPFSKKIRHQRRIKEIAMYEGSHD